MIRPNSTGPTPQLAELPGVRLAVSSEPREGAVIDEALIKLLTGGDTIMVRGLYQKPFEFVPAFKLILATNHKPEVRDNGYGIWRRVILVPFSKTIPEGQRDENLLEKLKVELSGILNWAIEGLKLYQQLNGFVLPEIIKEATKSYRNEMDVIGDWIREECIQAPDSFTQLNTLNSAYRSWCISNGYQPVTNRKLANDLHDRGFKRKPTAAARGHGNQAEEFPIKLGSEPMHDMSASDAKAAIIGYRCHVAEGPQAEISIRLNGNPPITRKMLCTACDNHLAWSGDFSAADAEPRYQTVEMPHVMRYGYY
jgi:phage/plasmid-associated DNA primase